MPPRIRFAGPVAQAVAGIRQGAQVKFEADEEERLRKHRMALAQLAEKRRQANLQAGVAAMRERGATGRQRMAGQQRMMEGQQRMMEGNGAGAAATSTRPAVRELQAY